MAGLDSLIFGMDDQHGRNTRHICIRIKADIYHSFEYVLLRYYQVATKHMN